MGKALVLDAVVPASSQLPKWSDKFPGMIDPTKLTFSDSFKRTPTIGVSDAIAGWQELFAGRVTQLTDTGAIADTGYSYAGVNTGAADVDISCLIDRSTVIGSAYVVGLTIRSTGTYDSAIRIVVPETEVQIQIADGGAPTTDATAPISLGATEDVRLRVRAIGNNLTVYINGNQVLTHTTSHNSTASVHGVIVTQQSRWRPISNVMIASV